MGKPAKSKLLKLWKLEKFCDEVERVKENAVELDRIKEEMLLRKT